MYFGSLPAVFEGSYGDALADHILHTLWLLEGKKKKTCQKKSEWWMSMRHESHSLQTRVKPPKGQTASLSSSTHMELSVYHPPSWQVVPHPRTYMSSSTACPLPPLAREVTEKGGGEVPSRRRLFFFPDLCLISVFALLCPGLLLIKRRWNIERIWRGPLIRKASV